MTLPPSTQVELRCIDCGKVFNFTSEERQFYAEKNLENLPKRCQICRVIRKLVKHGKDPGEYSLHACDYCGEKTMVPFKPSGRKPIYCLDCFRNKK